MACKECGKPKCTCGKDRCSSPAAIQINNTETVLFRKVSIPAAAGDETTNPPVPGAFCNALVFYEATGATFLYSSDGIPTRIDADVSGLETKIDNEIGERKAADQEIWTEIETIEASSDVVDVVGTYAALQAYDTSKLHNNDLIKVLQDETRDDAITYYRWSTSTNTFTYVGAEGPYYTASETDTLLSAKQDTLIAGTGITIAADGKTISASGAANTIFYRNSSESGATRHIYKNSDMTGLVSMQDLLDANEKGQVILRLSTASHPEDFSDAYLQNAYVGPSDYQMLFLDEKAYTSFDTTQSTDTTFYYSRRELQDKLTAGTNIQINGTTISATDTTYSDFTGATALVAGTHGLVPAPTTSDVNKYLKSDGTWATVASGATTTTFYWNSNQMYKDGGHTTVASYQDVANAYEDGQVIIVDEAAGSNGFTVTGIYYRPNDGAGTVDVSYVDYGTVTPAMRQYTYLDATSAWFGANEFSLQEKLTAGANISITTVNNVPNTISVTGMPVLYTTQGQNIDGAVTQKLFTDTVGDVETILQTLNSGNGV